MWDDFDFGGGDYSWDNVDWDASVGDITQDVTGGDTSWWDTVGDWGGSTTDAISNWDFGSTTGDVLDSLTQYNNWSEEQGNWLDQMSPLQDAPMSSNALANYGDTSKGVTQTLSNIFNSPLTGMAIKGLGALYTGQQNKKAANAYKNLAQSTTIDPFGSQRNYYQQQLQQATANPNSIPLIQQQTQALAKAQAIKDAAAGRRSNNATSSPGLLQAQSQAAQNYINSMMQPAGANITPNASAYTQAMGNAINLDTQGYASPLLNVLSNLYTSNQNQNTLDKLISAMGK